MARIRSIKPEFFDDEDLCVLPFQHRLCYIGLWCQADKEGRMEDRPKRLKARIFPYDDLDMDAILADLTRAGFILRYLVGGKAYIAIKKSSWDRHQRVRPDEPPSQIPTPEHGTACYAELGPNEEIGKSLRREDQADQVVAGNSDATVSPQIQIFSAECLGKERKGREGEGEDSCEALARSQPSDTSPAVAIFPTIGPKGAEWRLSEAQVVEWQSAFPGLDVQAEMRKALMWVKANPEKRKTVSGMPRFCLRWLTRAVDSGGARLPAARNPAASSAVPVEDYFEECKRIHGGECGLDRWRHHLRKEREAARDGIHPADARLA